MKTIVKKMLLPAGICLTVLLIGCPQNNGFKPDRSVQPHLSEQQKLEAEVDTVILKVAGKTDITAGELKQENITASGYDSSYAIKYETIKGNSEDRKAEITFLLKKDGLISKKRILSITGFKAPSAAPTGLELINAEADKVSVMVAGKETIFADELAANKDKITASGFDAAYTINHIVIKGDAAKREAEITFRLEKASLHSKTRTVTVTGFKEKVSAPDTADISEQELLKLFDLTETKIPASDAAKKIAAAQGKTVKNFVFEEAHAIAYDDKTGTFTVKVKGLKNGKPFEKTISVTGFANPYELIFPSLSEAELDFSDAIEHNKTLDTFISESAYKSALLKKLSFSDNTTGTLSLGTHDRYSLAAVLEENGDKIKIRPVYKVKYLKKEAGGSETSTEADKSGLFIRLRNDLTKPYFSKDDVFRYLLGKTDDTFLKVYPDTFASMHYAFTKHLNRTAGGTGSLLDDAAIQDIFDRYKNDGGHFKMEIVSSVYKPRDGGIKADDYTGSLEIKYCIAEAAQIEAMLDGGHMPYPIVAIKEAKRTGFRKVTKENAGTLFNFQIKLTAGTKAQNAWKQKPLLNHPLLRAEYDSNLKKDVYKVNNPFKTAAKYYTFKVNGKEAEDVFALDNPKFFSKCADGADIFIEQISLNKENGSDKLKIHIQFTGAGEGISIEKKPE